MCYCVATIISQGCAVFVYRYSLPYSKFESNSEEQPSLEQTNQPKKC